MARTIEAVADKFLKNEPCSQQELAALKGWLSDPTHRGEVEEWMAVQWVGSEKVTSLLSVEEVIRHIELRERNVSLPKSHYLRFLKLYQRVAAVVLIPLITAGISYFLIQRPSTQNYIETFAPRGQKSQIVLSDGTRIWLNSETQIRYPGRFAGDSRDVYLSGEAFFEVTKNSRSPFIVHAGEFDVKVLGTKFNIKAYPDENEVETSLFEGKVNLIWRESSSSGIKEETLAPSQSMIYDRKNHRLAHGRFSREEIDGWKKNQLLFKDDTFSNLVRKVERWYDVEIIYDEKLFNDRRLTVELYEGERIERLMEIVGLTLSVDYRYENGKIILTPKI